MEQVAIDYVKEADYNITDEDSITVLSGSSRGENIIVWISRLEKDPLRFKRHLNLTYYEGSIIKFKDETKIVAHP